MAEIKVGIERGRREPLVVGGGAALFVLAGAMVVATLATAVVRVAQVLGRRRAYQPLSQ
jgi:hypothetical protein